MKTKLTTIVGIFLLLELMAQLIPFAVLSALFEFPDILRQPASYALPLFRQHQSAIVPTYYIFMFSSLLYLPLTASFQNKRANQKSFSSSNWPISIFRNSYSYISSNRLLSLDHYDTFFFRYLF